MRFPFLTLFICSAAAVVKSSLFLTNAFVFDRMRVNAGEWGRLVTGNLVHFSNSHFVFNITALLIVGFLLEVQETRLVGLVYFLSAVAIGLIIYFCMPELHFYGGLSGIVTAALVYLCLNNLFKNKAQFSIYLFVFVFVILKITTEFISRTSILSVVTEQPFVPVPLSHLTGASVAVCVFGIKKYFL